MKTYAQTVIENAQEIKDLREREQYLTRKVRELDEQYELAKELGTPVKEINKAIEEIYNVLLAA